MKEHRVKSTIMTHNKLLNISYAVCYLEQVYFEDDTFKYIFKPYYNVLGLPDSNVFQGIPGLNLDLKKETYIRENKIPTFIYERTPQENREDLWGFLSEVNMDYLDHLEWLIRTDRVYTGDNLSTEAYHEPKIYHEPGKVYYGDKFILNKLVDFTEGNYKLIKFLLEVVIKGAYLESENFFINDDNRTSIHTLLLTLYQNEYKVRQKKQRDGIEKAKSQNRYKGRKRKKVSLPLLEEIIEKRERNEITVEEAMKELNLTSRSTYHRRVKEFKAKYSNPHS